MTAKTAFLFPGQGAQVVGMGKDIAEQYPAAAEIFEKADSVLGYKLSSLCFDGPEDKLNSTTFSQPAIYTVSAAILEVLRSESKSAGIVPDATAGLSLGEYTALYAAGLISFEDGLKLVSRRGKAMQEAADKTKGSMVSILKLDAEAVQDICEKAAEGRLLVAANFNCPGQIVISGEVEACERAVKLAEEAGALKAIMLKVAGAFHSEMMSPAADQLSQALAETTISDAGSIEVIANVNADYYSTAETIRTGLIKQLISPVLWQNCMEKMLADGYEKFYEIGPGRVLTGLMKKINRRTKVENLSSAQALSDFMASL